MPYSEFSFGKRKIEKEKLEKRISNKDNIFDNEVSFTEFSRYKKLFEREINNNRIILNDLSAIKAFAIRISEANETLINSNKSQLEKIENLIQNNNFYKIYYKKYMKLLKNRRKNARSLAMNYVENGEKQIKSSRNDRNINLNSYIDNITEECNKEVNISVLANDEKNEKIQIRKESNKNFYQNQISNKMDVSVENFNDEEFNDFTLEQSKIFLFNLAKDLYMNTNLKGYITKNVLKNIEFGSSPLKIQNYLKMKRSMSNPLEYISKEDNLCGFEILNRRNLKRISDKKFKKTSITKKVPNSEKKNPFQADLSNIAIHGKETKEEENKNQDSFELGILQD